MNNMAQFITGDCCEELAKLPDKSVHCCVTSPPYDNLRTYNGFKWNFEVLALQLYRVMCDGGIVCWNVGDSVIDGSESLTSMRQAIYFKDVVGFNIHDTMIYEKTNFGHPEKSRYHQLFEYVFVLSKGKPRCFNPIKDKKNIWAGHGPFGTSTMRKANGEQQQVKRNCNTEYGMRGNVWRCKTAGQENVCTPIDHPATMPIGLCSDLIRSWSNSGDTILDPFGGSGTTALAAVQLNRKAILIELNPVYTKLAQDRCKHAIPIPQQSELIPA